MTAPLVTSQNVGLHKKGMWLPQRVRGAFPSYLRAMLRVSKIPDSVEQHAGVAGPPAKRCSPSWLLFGAAGREKGQGRNWQRFLTGLGFTSRQILQPLGLFTPATDKTGTWPQDFKTIPYFIFYLKNKQANQHKRTRQPNFSIKHFALGINLIKNLFTPLSYA